MKVRVIIIFASLMIIFAKPSFSLERYMCFKVTSDDAGAFQKNREEYVELTLDQDTVTSRVHIDAATKDLTFSECAAVKADGSNFSRWFATECRILSSVDGSPYTIEAYLAGAYAGISPKIDDSYLMAANLAEIGAKIGAGTPERTFVIYADRKPEYEFFCYDQEPDGNP